jgi:hypothetical protein
MQRRFNNISADRTDSLRSSRAGVLREMPHVGSFHSAVRYVIRIPHLEDLESRLGVVTISVLAHVAFSRQDDSAVSYPILTKIA